MPRARSGVVRKNRVKTVLNRTKGFRGRRGKIYKIAKNTMMKALSNAFIGRKLKKRNFRYLWISRINAICRNEGITYSKFINGLKKADINMNRKTLANLAVNDRDAFLVLIDKAKKAVA
ncbi:MAG: 50S ribosomal protein L20 [Spirochaetes bacterium]|nr:50S ribosomal protein L20 [Spirochaetota bacterium]